MRIEELHDRTRSVVRKAARLSQNSWGSKPKFVANVALREVTSGLFVSVRGDEVSGQLMLAICASHICLSRRAVAVVIVLLVSDATAPRVCHHLTLGLHFF
jgi:hypothetical protein